jgi:hypothetical protein
VPHVKFWASPSCKPLVERDQITVDRKGTEEGTGMIISFKEVIIPSCFVKEVPKLKATRTTPNNAKLVVNSGCSKR